MLLRLATPRFVLKSIDDSVASSVPSAYTHTRRACSISVTAEELLVSPLPNWLIVAGYMGGGILRGVLVGSVVTIV